jgi:hypothetical protein
MIHTISKKSIKRRLGVAVLAAAAIGLASCGPTAKRQTQTASVADIKPFSRPQSVAFAGKLWRAMEAKKLVGKNAIIGFPYDGNKPHGAWLENLETDIEVDGRVGHIIVKNNYGPSADVDPETIMTNRLKQLGAVTVMFRHEAGYDAQNKNWFWAKYLPDGSLDKNPNGMQLAGRVAKGAPKGCIACHTGAPGGDMVCSHDRFAR